MHFFHHLTFSSAAGILALGTLQSDLDVDENVTEK